MTPYFVAMVPFSDYFYNIIFVLLRQVPGRNKPDIDLTTPWVLFIISGMGRVNSIRYIEIVLNK